MSIQPGFLIECNAESATVYHNEPCLNDQGHLLSGDGGDGDTVWHLPRHHAVVTESRTLYPDLSAIRQTTTVQNDGDTPLTVELLASAFVQGIGATGRRWYDDRFVIHYAHMGWQGEGQWRSASPEELGLYPTYNHLTMRTITFSSSGSWSTSRLYPLVLVEDKERGETHYFEIHSGGSWYIEISARGDGDESSLCVLLSAAYEGNDGWYIDLAPGECYTTVPAVYGCAKGSFEAAVAELTAYKRRTALPFPGDVVPVCFNDYMNCLWAQPTRERLTPLIRAAAEAGCEYFVIDAGWFSPHNAWQAHLGDWEPYDAHFGEGGLRGILGDIVAAGMKPGLWIESETVDSRSDFARAHPEALLRRHGHPIGALQCFMDYRLPVVRTHMMQVFDRLYDMGVRFIKNDYNHTTGVYIDAPDGVSGAEAHARHVKAFQSFVDEVTATHPDLIIEGCSSGANRCDHGTLSHFHLQSTSDQEDYDRYPSIIQGMLALLPPEQAGVWAYPYPVAYSRREAQAEIFPVVSDPVRTMINAAADGNNTAFNMVNGLMGAMYLSGRLPYADDLNRRLIADAVALYKKNRTVMAASVPVYPQGFFRLSENGHTSLGLLNRAAGKLLLAVWQIRTDKTKTTVDLTPYLNERAAVTLRYPTLPGYAHTLEAGRLQVAFPEGNCAAYFEIDL